jgi:hypothetical protein
MTAADLWARLSADGHVEGERPEPDRPASPWYVRVMLGIAGWIGAGFLILFVGAAFAFILEDAAFAAVAGLICCAAAFGLFRAFEGNDFAEQFGLAVSLAGQVLIIVGLSQSLQTDDPAFYLAVAATQAALAAAVPNFLHRLLASGGAAIATALAIQQMSLHGLAAPLLCAGLAWIWLEPQLWAGKGRIWRPVGYGLVLALMLIETFRLLGAGLGLVVGSATAPWIAQYGPLLGRALTAAVLVWATLVVVRREGYAPPSRIGLAAVGAAVLFGLLALQMPGLASALLILLLGFSAGSRIVVGFGMLGLLGFVAHFYYSLHATLLAKSGILAVTGLCLLIAWFVLRRGFPSSGREAPDHA